MKGILLAGGAGTRLDPLTRVVSKQLLPIYDKPMIYYPLSVLMLADIQDILIISDPGDRPRFQQLLGDGSQLGCRFEYAEQPSPEGIAHAIILAEAYLENESFALALGDNIFYGAGLGALLRGCHEPNGAIIFAYEVQDPRAYGVVELDTAGKVIHLEEKPEHPRSNLAVPGIYFYDHSAIALAKSLTPSLRGELEITDLNLAFWKQGRLQAKHLRRGTAWLDTGSFDSLLKASEFVEVIEQRQGLKVGCIEEVAWRRGFIDDKQLERLATASGRSGYGDYLLRIGKAGRGASDFGVTT